MRSGSRRGAKSAGAGRTATDSEVAPQAIEEARFGLGNGAGLSRGALRPELRGLGPINGETFLLYVEKILAPTLSPGDVVVLDNLGSHKGKAARAIVRAKGAHLIFLPPYSPDLNPIEQVFAKLKHLVRKAQPRDVDATWRKAGQLLDLFSPAECANYLVNSGYGSV